MKAGISAALATAVLAALVIPSGCARKEAVVRGPIPVRTITVEAADGQASGPRYTGSVKAESNVPVAFRVGGYVVDAGGSPSLLSAGDAVKKGQILARVRQADYEAVQRQAAAGVGASQAQIFQAKSKESEASAAYAQALAAIEEARARRDSAKAQAGEAEHGVQQAQAALEEAQAGRRQAQAALDQALAGNEKAQSDYRRARQLLAARAATQAEFDAAQAQLDASAAQVSQAREAIQGIDAKEGQARSVIRQARSKVVEAQAQVRAVNAAVTRLTESRNAAAAAMREARGLVSQASSGLKASAAQQESARLALQDASLVCPIDGRVVARKIEIGALVGPGTPGFIVADTKRMKVAFSVPAVEHDRFAVGARIGFRVEGLSREFSGGVTSVSPSADPATRLFDIELTVDNPDGALKQGMTATVTPRNGPLSASFTVPFSALVGDGKGGQAVLVAAQGRLRKTPVKLGAIRGDQVEVKEGLRPGDAVVSEGAGLLSDGDQVEVLK